jgi:hypothetical protein
VCRAQYIATTKLGRHFSAVDKCIQFALKEYCSGLSWFDFGTSSLEDGQSIDGNLIAYKESWGASGIITDEYSINIV